MSETKTKFQGPGEWRSQAEELERNQETPKKEQDSSDQVVE